MMRAVIDTNILRVAAKQHENASDDCVSNCVRQLMNLQKEGVVVIDDGYEILGEYLKSPKLLESNGTGQKFLKWLLQNQSNIQRVEQVTITETATKVFAEFPDQALQAFFDPSDRMFVAVANAHPEKPPIWQAVDCKWLNWWPELQAKGIQVEFLCPSDVRKFYLKKYPKEPEPKFPD